MSIAKSASQVKEVIFGKAEPESQNKLSMTDGELTYATVPVDVFRYFDKDMGKIGDTELARIKDIVASHAGVSVGDLLLALRRDERHLGPTHISESRINKLWNYYKVSNQIKELEKKRESMKGSIYI